MITTVHEKSRTAVLFPRLVLAAFGYAGLLALAIGPTQAIGQDCCDLTSVTSSEVEIGSLTAGGQQQDYRLVTSYSFARELSRVQIVELVRIELPDFAPRLGSCLASNPDAPMTTKPIELAVGATGKLAVVDANDCAANGHDGMRLLDKAVAMVNRRLGGRSFIIKLPVTLLPKSFKRDARLVGESGTVAIEIETRVDTAPSVACALSRMVPRRDIVAVREPWGWLRRDGEQWFDVWDYDGKPHYTYDEISRTPMHRTLHDKERNVFLRLPNCDGMATWASTPFGPWSAPFYVEVERDRKPRPSTTVR